VTQKEVKLKRTQPCTCHELAILRLHFNFGAMFWFKYILRVPSGTANLESISGYFSPEYDSCLMNQKHSVQQRNNFTTARESEIKPRTPKMSGFSEPPPDAYQTDVLFWMPTEHGRVLAIAFSKSKGEHIIAAYSVLTLFIFLALWSIFTHIVIACVPQRVPRDVENRQQIVPGDVENNELFIVGFYNSREALGAVIFIFKFLCMAKAHMAQSISRESGGVFRPSVRYPVLLFVLSITFAIGSVISGVLVPGSLVIGTVAPAVFEHIYFPRPPADTSDASDSKVQALRAPAALRAIGAVDGAMKQLLTKVLISRPTNTASGGKQIRTIVYSYNISGFDFGLQRSQELLYKVHGYCTTEYNWLDTNHTNENVDRYKLWELPNRCDVKRLECDMPPRAQIVPYWNPENIPSGNSFPYAIVIHSVDRQSFTQSSDPWYLTQPAAERPGLPCNGLSPTGSNPPGYIVVSARPPLSCVQNDTWEYMGNSVNSVNDLDQLDGLKIPKEWHKYLQLNFAAPKIVDFGASLGNSMLVSSASHLRKFFDAGSSSIEKDLTRLIFGTYVASRDIFKDSLMVQEKYGIDNEITFPHSQQDKGVADFVVSSAAVSTFSVAGLVAVPAVLLGVTLIARFGNIFCSLVFNGPRFKTFQRRLIAFDAVQLYRYLMQSIRTSRIPDLNSRDWTIHSTSHDQDGVQSWHGCLAPVPYYFPESRLQFEPVALSGGGISMHPKLPTASNRTADNIDLNISSTVVSAGVISTYPKSSIAGSQTPDDIELANSSMPAIKHNP